MNERFQEKLLSKGDKHNTKKLKDPGSCWDVRGCLVLSCMPLMLCVPPIGHIIKEDLFVSHAQIGLLFLYQLLCLWRLRYQVVSSPINLVPKKQWVSVSL